MPTFPCRTYDLTVAVVGRNSKSFKIPLLRIVILLLSTFAMTFAMSNPLVLNFTIICMTNSTHAPTATSAASRAHEFIIANYSAAGKSYGIRNPFSVPTENYLGYFEWSVTQISTALSAFAWGATLFILPLSALTQQYGARKVFTIATLLSSMATIVCPLAALSDSFALFVVVRVLQGIGYAASLPMLAAMTASWSPPGEKCQFLALATSCIQFSPMLTMPIGGLVCSSPLGWPLAFYSVGASTMLVTLLWMLLYNDDPGAHPLLSSDELSLILAGTNSELVVQRSTSSPASAASTVPRIQQRRKRQVPYAKTLRSLPVWAIIVASFGNMFGIQLIIAYMPTYLRQVMNFDIKSIGFLSSAPHIGLFLLKTFAGILSDKTKCCGPCYGNETIKMRIFNAIAFLGMAACYVTLTFVGHHRNGYLALALFTLGASILGFNVGSFFRSVTIVALEFSGWVMGLVQLTTCVVMVLLPFVVGFMTPNGRAEEWSNVFLLVAVLLFLTNIFFGLFGSGEAASWALNQKPAVIYVSSSRQKNIPNIGV